jgi:hypothetical protein
MSRGFCIKFLVKPLWHYAPEQMPQNGKRTFKRIARESITIVFHSARDVLRLLLIPPPFSGASVGTSQAPKRAIDYFPQKEIYPGLSFHCEGEILVPIVSFLRIQNYPFQSPPQKDRDSVHSDGMPKSFRQIQLLIEL